MAQVKLALSKMVLVETVDEGPRASPFLQLVVKLVTRNKIGAGKNGADKKSYE